MMAATNSYFQDDDERKAEQTQTGGQTPDASYTGPRTLDGRPAPQASGSRGTRKPAAQSQQKKKGIATLGSLGGASHVHEEDEDDSDDDFDDDEDDDNRGDLFAGGEKSGLAVQDPKKEGGGSKKIIGDLLAKAKAYA